MAKSKYRALKYDGDDLYSWAVFYAKDVKGLRGTVFYGQAKPLLSGCDRRTAKYYINKMENK